MVTTDERNRDALLASLRRAASSETAEAQVRRYIVQEGLRPGDRLPSEAELATVLGSSRLVVREALCSLEAVGLIGSRAGSGWFVRPFDVSTAARALAQSLAFHPRALADLLTVRRATESDLVARIAGTLNERDLAALADLVDRMRWRASRGELFVIEDGEFHRRLLASSGNLIALTLVDLHLGVIEEAYSRGLPGPEDPQRVAAAHAEILDALRAGDGPRAAAAMRAHHDSSQERVQAWAAAQADLLAPATNPLNAAVHAALLWPGPGKG
jgi:DNA-binding FadR family transcriptional regulator